MSVLQKEIYAQPRVLRKLVRQYRQRDIGLLERLRNRCIEIKDHKIILAGMGASLYASLIATPWLSAHGVNALVFEAGELLYYNKNVVDNNSLFLLISQSGESIETVKLAAALQGRTFIVAITNNLQSSLARHADLTLPLYAGTETTISNKTFTNTLALLLLISRTLTGENVEELGSELIPLSYHLEELLADQNFKEKIAGATALLSQANFVHFIARGPSLAAAYQGALIFKEGVKIPTEALPGASFRHGPLELAGKDHYAIFLIPKGRTQRLLVNLAIEISRLGSHVIVITDSVNNSIEKRAFQITLELSPGQQEELFALASVLPLELLMIELATSKGIEAGRFQFASKVTRKE